MRLERIVNPLMDDEDRRLLLAEAVTMRDDESIVASRHSILDTSGTKPLQVFWWSVEDTQTETTKWSNNIN